jgi:hypothetical protein
MKFTRDPAYSTSTGPDPVADGEAAADEVAAPEVAAGADELDELEELLDEHAAAARTTHTAPAITAAREARLGGALRKIITG